MSSICRRVLRRWERYTEYCILAVALGLWGAMVLGMGYANASVIGTRVFINELHYDNAGRDIDEFVEVVIPDGLLAERSRMRVTLYNGSSGTPYGSAVALTDFTWDTGSSHGGVNFFYYDAFGSVQNGAPDGLALSYDIDSDGAADEVQFLSYEGVFRATSGDAIGRLSMDIGVSEGSSTSAGQSLQLRGSGRLYGDFTWSPPAASTKGSRNQGQVFSGSHAPVPEPSALVIWCVILVPLVVQSLIAYWPLMRASWRQASETAPATGSGTTAVESTSTPNLSNAVPS